VCSGVLEPDELSSIIEGVEKGEKHTLPGIQEEVHRSADSISTLESDCLTLESLEGDLFEDVRASIQKSSKVSSAANARSNTGSGVTEIRSVVCKYYFLYLHFLYGIDINIVQLSFPSHCTC
jgi:hypothetical protein